MYYLHYYLNWEMILCDVKKTKVWKEADWGSNPSSAIQQKMEPMPFKV